MLRAIPRLSGFFPLLLLAVLAALTFWLNQAMQPNVAPVESQREDPDSIVDNVTAYRMDANGNIKHTLHARRMTHYPHDGSNHLVAPHFTSNASARAPMTITSRTARISSGGEHVYFETDVRAVRAAYDGHSEMVMETSFLHVTPDENIARTDKPVTITDANTVAHAIGLELNSETRIIKFLSSFRGTYHDPDRAKSRR
ncbi:MAG: LPS export ABC transporter periplasmic protein LptC [Burkholderiales bacterium]|jgi:lipopolysaccharide export system protein LptC|nr:LPS export ABC transporter periplasmic protein LptC [Burkholderiales bacterium]MDP2399201.1 LPS export ABC transporter periplasmic protein LptC [Burkholderiales bacterium]